MKVTSYKVFNDQTTIPRTVLFETTDRAAYLADAVALSMYDIDKRAQVDGVELDWWGSLAITVRPDGPSQGVLLTVRVNGESSKLG